MILSRVTAILNDNRKNITCSNGERELTDKMVCAAGFVLKGL